MTPQPSTEFGARVLLQVIVALAIEHRARLKGFVEETSAHLKPPGELSLPSLQ